MGVTFVEGHTGCMVRRQQPKTKGKKNEGALFNAERVGKKVSIAPSARSVEDSSQSDLQTTESDSAPIPITSRGRTMKSPRTPRGNRRSRGREKSSPLPSPRNDPALFTVTETSEQKKRVFRKNKRKLSNSSTHTSPAFSHRSAEVPRNTRRPRPRTMAPMQRLSLESRVGSRDDSSFDLPIQPQGGFELEEVSQSDITESAGEFSTASPNKEKLSRRKLLRRIVPSPSGQSYRENLSRLSQLNLFEKEIEYARKLILRSAPDFALQKLDAQIQLLDSQPNRTNREQFARATALYLKSRCYLTLNSLVKAEINARHALMDLDILITRFEEDVESPALTERTKNKSLADNCNWLTGQELSVNYLWSRKSIVENQIGHILWQKDCDMNSVQWLQRSLYSRETRAQTEGLAETYVKLSEILVSQARTCFENIRKTFQEVRKMYSFLYIQFFLYLMMSIVDDPGDEAYRIVGVGEFVRRGASVCETRGGLVSEKFRRCLPYDNIIQLS